jgi:DNA-binding NtrC family response regulator
MGEPKILIVDDDPVILNLVRKAILVKYRGAEVHMATSAQDAQQCAMNDRYDVILSDIQMPAKNGIDLILETRSQKPTPTIVLMTGSPELLPQAFHAGAYACLIKPIPFDCLIKVLRRAAEYHGLKRQLEGYRRALRASAHLRHTVTEDILARVRELQKRLSGMRRLEQCQSGLISFREEQVELSDQRAEAGYSSAIETAAASRG